MHKDDQMTPKERMSAFFSGGEGVSRLVGGQGSHGLAERALLGDYAKGQGCCKRVTCGGSPFLSIIQSLS